MICSHLHNTGRITRLLSYYYCLVILKSFRIYRLARHMYHLRALYQTMAMCLREVCGLIISGTHLSQVYRRTLVGAGHVQ